MAALTFGKSKNNHCNSYSEKEPLKITKIAKLGILYDSLNNVKIIHITKWIWKIKYLTHFSNTSIKIKKSLKLNQNHNSV